MAMSEKLQEVSVANSPSKGRILGVRSEGTPKSAQGGLVGPGVHWGVYPAGDGAIGKF